MAVSVFELFKIGVGPSSSHTVGPMLAAHTFVQRLDSARQLEQVASLRVTLFGSLAFTGRGHGTDKAVLLGLSGERPDQVDPDKIDGIVKGIQDSGIIKLAGKFQIGFSEKADLIFNRRETLPHHSNGMRFAAFDESGETMLTREYYSVGGGLWSTRMKRHATVSSRTRPVYRTHSVVAMSFLPYAPGTT